MGGLTTLTALAATRVRRCLDDAAGALTLTRRRSAVTRRRRRRKQACRRAYTRLAIDAPASRATSKSGSG